MGQRQSNLTIKLAAIGAVVTGLTRARQIGPGPWWR